MTLSAEKLRITYLGEGGGGTGNLLPIIVQCGEVVESNIELDLMILQDVSGSYPASTSVPFVKNIANCVLTAFPSCRLGLCYFSDFPINPYGRAIDGDVPFGIQRTLQVVDSNDISTWTLPQLVGGDIPEAQLDAIKRGAESGAFGWRPVETYRKRIIVLNTDTIPHDSSLEPGAPHTTRAATVQACLDNNIWPIYVLTNGGYEEPYELGYGISGLGSTDTTTGESDLLSQILTAIYKGILTI